MDLHREVLAAAERAADAAEHEPHLLRRQVERGGELVAVHVQPLGGDEQVHAAVLGRHREPGLGPEEGLVLHADLVLAGHDDVPGGVRVAVADRHVAQQVARRVQRRAGRVERALGIGQRLEHLVVDLDPLRRRARGLGVVGGHDRDGLALVADVLPREHGLVGDLQPVGLAAGHVLVGEHGLHAGHAQRGADLDRADLGPRMRRAQRRAPQHPVRPRIGRVGELALDLRDPVGAADALADAGAGLGDGAHAIAPARCASRSDCALRSRAATPSSNVRTSPPETTTRPPTSSVSTSGRGPSTSAATGSAIPAWSTPSSRHSATSASLPGSSEPISASRPRQRAPWIVPELERLADVERARAAGQAREEQRLAQLAAELAGLVGGGAVDPEPDRRAAADQRRDGSDPRAEPRVGARAVRDARARLAEAAHLRVVQVHAVREPDVVAEPAEPLQVLDRAAAEQLDAEALLVLGLRHVRVQPHAAGAGQLGRLAHQLLRDAERGAGGERDPHHRVGRGVVVLVDRGLAGGEDRVAVLDDLVRRQPAGGAAEVHRAAARVEAQADLARRLDLDRQQVARVAREQVVVVGGGGAARARERDQPRARGRLLDRGVDVRPDRIELLQPLEQRVVLRQPARGPLVEVVVAVDEAGRGEHAAPVDADLVLVARGRGARADLVDEAVADDDVAVRVLGAVAVDGGDRAALDHEPGHRDCAAIRTASRIFS